MNRCPSAKSEARIASSCGQCITGADVRAARLGPANSASRRQMGQAMMWFEGRLRRGRGIPRLQYAAGPGARSSVGSISESIGARSTARWDADRAGSLARNRLLISWPRQADRENLSQTARRPLSWSRSGSTQPTSSRAKTIRNTRVEDPRRTQSPPDVVEHTASFGSIPRITLSAIGVSELEPSLLAVYPGPGSIASVIFE
jgi:hypothetical protein